MATTISGSRKRKNVCNGIFEIDMDDCSPESSPLPADELTVEPIAKSTKLETSEPRSSSQDSGVGLDFCSQISNISILNEPVCVSERSLQVEHEEGELKDVVDNVVQSNKPQNESDVQQSVVEDDNRNDQYIMNISFKDENIAKLYKPKFVQFIKSFVELNILNEDDLKISIAKNGDIVSHSWVVVDEVSQITELSTPKSKKHRKKSKSKKDLFVLDTNPSIMTKENQSLRYTSKFSVIAEKSANEEVIVPVTAQTCFNCNGSHSLKDCPEPRNFEKINAARQKFKMQSKAPRYHLESDQMYNHLVPGKVSDKLRKALGLHRRDLPPYVYKMRILGYPPGWIEEAQVSHSNLSMFDIEGQDVKNNVKKKSGIDPDKIVEYPGFNAPMEEGVCDDYRFYNVPPFSHNHSKQAMIEYINKMHEKSEDNLEECSMEIDSVEEKPANHNTKCEESNKENGENDLKDKSDENKDAPLINNSTKTDDQNLESTELDDLESKRKELLAELGITTILPPSDSKETGDEISVELKSINSNPDLNHSPIPRVVKKSSFGTPVLKSASPFSKLPKPDKFSQDISPVINFENLPNSTGKYEQMTGVLQKVRTTLKNLQTET